MKKIFQFPLVLMLSMFVFVACSDDDDNKSGDVLNQVEIDGETFKIKDAGQIFYGKIGDNEELVNVDLILDLENDHGIFLEIALAKENKKLIKGTYTVKETKEEFSIFAGALENKDDEFSVTSGKVVIDVDGETYMISLDLVVEKETKITGTYKGKLVYEDDTEGDDDDDDDDDKEEGEK